VYFIQYLVLVVFIAWGCAFTCFRSHGTTTTRRVPRTIESAKFYSLHAALDRYEKVLVDSASAFNVVVTPEDITDREETLNALAQNLMLIVVSPGRAK
jgi:hypothetical protein